MTRHESERLRDIRDAIATIHAHVGMTERNMRDEDATLLHDALLYQFVVIGEAVKHLAPETREAAPEIAWDDIAGLRDLIAHEYFRIDIDRVLAVIRSDIPPLEQAINRLLEEQPR